VSGDVRDVDLPRGALLHDDSSTRRIMLSVLLALAPVCAAAVWRFGSAAAAILVASLAAAVLTERLLARGAAPDGSAAVSGVILALLLPSTCPWWLAALGGALAVGLGKHLFGGLGTNPFNPTALSRGVLMAAFPAHLFANRWPGVDGVSVATPLSKELGTLEPSLSDLLRGFGPATLAEAAPLAVVAGGILLLVLRAADWRLPLTYLAAVVLATLVLPGSERVTAHAPWLVGNPALHVLRGGTLLVAFFLITDPVTAPFSSAGRALFAALAGVFTVFVRPHTYYPDGAVLAVLLANAAVPWLDRLTLPGAQPAAPPSLPAKP